jgi:hypothetical protein
MPSAFGLPKSRIVHACGPDRVEWKKMTDTNASVFEDDDED